MISNEITIHKKTKDVFVSKLKYQCDHQQLMKPFFDSKLLYFFMYVFVRTVFLNYFRILKNV